MLFPTFNFVWRNRDLCAVNLSNLTKYFNNLHPEGRRAFARDLDFSLSSLKSTISRGKGLTVQMAASVEYATGGVFKRTELCQICKDCPHGKDRPWEK